MTILPARVMVLLTGLALAAGGCGRRDVHLTERVETSGLPAVDVRVSLRADHAADGDRYLRGAREALKAIGEWLGPFPDRSLDIVDPPRRISNGSHDSAAVLESTPWLTARLAMVPELASARLVCRRFWSHSFDSGALAPAFVDALTEYAARRIVTRLFNEDGKVPGMSKLEGRYFGGFVPWDTHIAVFPESDFAGRPTLTLSTLEQWIGKPAFDAAIAEFVRRFRGRRPTLTDFAEVVSSVSGQDVSWLFEHAFDASNPIDYAVHRVDTSRERDGRYRTAIVAGRRGDGVFSGSGGARIGRFQRGRGVEIQITFADGTVVEEHWDGRDRTTEFQYDSATPAVNVKVDPRQVILVDVKRTNNTWTRNPRALAAANRWSAHWLNWLQNVLLTGSFFA